MALFLCPKNYHCRGGKNIGFENYHLFGVKISIRISYMQNFAYVKILCYNLISVHWNLNFILKLIYKEVNMASDKKSLNLQILKILKEHSDVANRLSQSKIKEYLKNEYEQYNIDGRTINANIDNLNVYLDNAIEYRIEKVKSRGKIIEKRYDFYIVRDFDESELRLIIDSILSSKSIPESQGKQLIEKLRNEASENFSYMKSSIKKYTSGLKINDELFTSIEVLGEAIENKRKVQFKYFDYDINKDLVARTDKDGNDKIYVLTPLKMVVNCGRYYLFGILDISDELYIYRIDKIKMAKVLNEHGRDTKSIKSLKDDMDLGKHVAEHIFMTIGPSETIIFEFEKEWISLVIDWFGKDIELKMKNKNICIGRVKVNVNAFANWLMMCSFTNAKVTYPKTVIQVIKERIIDMRKVYKC